LVQHIFPAVLTWLESRTGGDLLVTQLSGLRMHTHEEWLLKTNPFPTSG